MSRRPSYYLNGVSLAGLGFQPTPGESARRHGLTIVRSPLRIPGALGELTDGAPVSAATRTIVLEGEVRGTTRTDCLEKVRTILAHAGRGLVELRAVDASDRVILVERDREAIAALDTPSLAESDAVSRTARLTLRFLAAEPAWRDREPQLLAIGQTAVPLPLGYSVPSDWTLEIFGSELGTVVDPEVRYEDAGGNAVATLALTGTLDWGTDATARYRISTAGLAPRIRRVTSGVWGDADADLTSGTWFQLNPHDGWPQGGQYPTLRLFDASARATGLLTFTKRFEL
jgi:hypothetical protein